MLLQVFSFPWEPITPNLPSYYDSFIDYFDPFVLFDTIFNIIMLHPVLTVLVSITVGFPILGIILSLFRGR